MELHPEAYDNPFTEQKQSAPSAPIAAKTTVHTIICKVGPRCLDTCESCAVECRCYCKASWQPVWILHTRYGCRMPCCAEQARGQGQHAKRGTDGEVAGWQPVPVHRIPPHPGCLQGAPIRAQALWWCMPRCVLIEDKLTWLHCLCQLHFGLVAARHLPHIQNAYLQDHCIFPASAQEITCSSLTTQSGVPFCSNV